MRQGRDEPPRESIDNILLAISSKDDIDPDTLTHYYDRLDEEWTGGAREKVLNLLRTDDVSTYSAAVLILSELATDLDREAIEGLVVDPTVSDFAKLSLAPVLKELGSEMADDRIVEYLENPEVAMLQVQVRLLELVGSSELGVESVLEDVLEMSMERRLGFIDWLGMSQDSRAARLLIPLLEAESTIVVLAAVKSLQQLGPVAAQQSFPALNYLLANHSNRLVKKAARAALDQLTAQTNSDFQAIATTQMLKVQQQPLYRTEREPLGEANTLQSLGDLESRLGHLDEARLYYDSALPLFRAARDRLGEANALKSLGDLERRLGHLNQARVHYEVALPLFHTEGDRLGEANTLQSLGDVFIQQKNWAEASKYYESALPLYTTERDPLGLANTFIDLGRSRCELGDYDQGLKDLQQAKDLFLRVQNPLWARRAEEYLIEMQDLREKKIGERAKAAPEKSNQVVNKEVVPIVPAPGVSPMPADAAMYWMDQGFMHFNANRFGKALTAYEQVIRLDPRSAPAYKGQGDALYRLNLFEEALAAYEQAIRLNPGFALAYNGQGDALFRLNRLHEALAAFERSIQLDPELLVARYNKGKTLHYLDSPEATQALEQTITIFEAVIHRDPDSAPAYNCKGNALDLLSRHEEALAAYEQAIHLNPDFAYAYNNLGNMYHHFSRHEEALAAYEQAIHLDPDFAYAYSNLGDEYNHFSRHEEALAAYEQAIHLDPYDSRTQKARDEVLTTLMMDS